MVDAVRLIATAQRLIGENGRSITLVAFDDTLADVNAPWNGPADPRSTPEATLVISAVAVEPSSARALGLSYTVEDLVKRFTKIYVVSAGADVDLTPYQEVLDEGVRARISLIEVLRPGSATMVSFLGVAR